MKTKLADLMRADLISLDLDVSDKQELFRETTRPLVKAGELDEEGHELLVAAIREREDYSCTAVEGGIALPHAYAPVLPANRILFARAAKGVDFGEEGCGEVRLVFVLVGPRREPTEHLMILARLVRMLKDERFFSALRSVKDANALLDAVRAVESRHF